MKNSNAGPVRLDWSKLLGFEQVADHRDVAQTGRLGKIGDKFGKVGRKFGRKFGAKNPRI